MRLMQIGFSLDNLTRFVRVGPSQSDVSAASPYSVVSPSESAQLSLNSRRVDAVGQTLTELDDLLARAQVRTRSSGASVRSESLGLNTTESASTIESTEEVNTATTSYTPFGPEFTGSGNSTALPEISGVYNGENGTDSLRFLVTRTGVHGVSRITVKVYDGNDDRIKTINIRDNHDLDREYNIGNGLTFSLGVGTLIQGDEFFLDVYDNVPSAVDPDKPFDGTRNDRPNLDQGEAVTAGSFEINGATINVNADDTINSVLGKINSSAANVNAVFDASSETVKVTQLTPGSSQDIDFQNDTSGFLDAVKLTGATVTPGTDREAETALEQSSRFESVTSGALNINGINFNIDVSQDSLTDIVNQINDADLGITASLSQDGQRFSLNADEEGIAIRLDDQGTQFFDALGIAEKTYLGAASSGLSRYRTYRIADQVTETVDLLNEIFDPDENEDSTALNSLRDSIVATLRSSTPDGDSGIGLLFSLDSPVGRRFGIVDRHELTRSLRHDLSNPRGFLGGMIAGLRGAMAAYGANYGDAGIASGTMLNTQA